MSEYRACVYALSHIEKPKEKRDKTLFPQGLNTIALDITPLSADNQNVETVLYGKNLNAKGVCKKTKDNKWVVELKSPKSKEGIKYTMVHTQHEEPKKGLLRTNPLAYDVVAEAKDGRKQTAKGHVKLFKFKTSNKSLKKSDIDLLQNFVTGFQSL